MEYVSLKNSDIKISRMAMGTWGFSGAKEWGPGDDRTAMETIHQALDCGINAFDSAERYGGGHAEEVLGKAIQDRREQAVVCTKVYTTNLRYEDVISHCEESLRRLNTDYIDIYQIHWPSKTIPLEETLGAMEQLKRDGKIRELGVCNFGAASLESCKGHPIVTNQMPYSLLWRLVENTPVLEKCREQGMSIFTYSPLAQGLLTGKYRTLEDVPMNRRTTRYYSGKWQQGRHNDTGFEEIIFPFLDRLRQLCEESGYTMAQIALNFLRAQSCVSSVLIGCRTPQQLQQNLESFETKVPEDVVARAAALSAELTPQMGTNVDLWEDQNGGRFF